MDEHDIPAGLGPKIADHVLLRKIAQGSYGEIWLARSTLGHFRAVKIVRSDKFTDLRPYDREFNGIRNFEPVSREHDGFLDILQVGRDDSAGYFYYVMELADDARQAAVPRSPQGLDTPSHGPAAAAVQPDRYVPHTFSWEIRERGPLPVDEVVRLGIELLEGLQYLHDKGLIHRDIKPSNIVFVGGRPKLADVGLVAELDATLSLVGTIGYMPPEGPGTPQADLYSLGKVLYEAVTGKDRQEFPELPIQPDSGDVDAKMLELNEVLLRACATHSERRYSSAGEMLADLKRLHGGESLVRMRARRRLARRIGVLAALILAASAVAILARWVMPGERIIAKASDDFSGQQLNETKWSLSTSNWSSAAPDIQGTHGFDTRLTNGELMLEARAEHDRGIQPPPQPGSIPRWISGKSEIAGLTSK